MPGVRSKLGASHRQAPVRRLYRAPPRPRAPAPGSGLTRPPAASGVNAVSGVRSWGAASATRACCWLMRVRSRARSPFIVPTSGGTSAGACLFRDRSDIGDVARQNDRGHRLQLAEGARSRVSTTTQATGIISRRAELPRSRHLAQSRGAPRGAARPVRPGGAGPAQKLASDGPRLGRPRSRFPQPLGGGRTQARTPPSCHRRSGSLR